MKVLLVDGLNLIRRIFAAIPNPENTDSIDHFKHSCRSSLLRALNQHQPSHCIVVFESHGNTWRHAIYPEYKKKRSAMPEALQQCLTDIKDIFSKIGATSFSMDGFEADDIIATIASRINEKGGQSIILSTDRIHCQLLGDRIQVYDHFSEIYLDIEFVRHKFQVTPKQIPELLALAGDSSLSIPGIRSIGLKTAAKLINEHGDLDTIFKKAEEIPGALGKALVKGQDAGELALQLFKLKTDISLGINLNQFRNIPMSQ